MADITQDTVDTAKVGGGPFGTQMSKLTQRGEDLAAKSVATQTKIDQTNTATEETLKAKAAATAPGQAELVKKSGEAPETPKLERTPEYEKPQMKPDDYKESFFMLMAASLMVGASSRSPYNNMMTAMTGAMDGFQKRDDEMVKQSMQVFDKNLASVKERNSAMRAEFEDNWKKHKNDLDTLRLTNEMIAAKYDQEITVQAVRSKSLTDQQKFIEQQIGQNNQLETRLTQMQQHAEEMAQRRSAQAQAHADAQRTVQMATKAAASGATGADYLKQLAPEYRDIVQGIAEGRINPSTLSIKGGHREQILGMVAQYDPSYNQYDAGNAQKAIRDFNTGKQGNNVRSFNVALEHLDTLQHLSEAMKNNDIQAVNQLSNWWKTQTGSEAPTDFNAAKQLVADEVVKAIVGTGGGVHDREEAAKTISGKSSPEQLMGVINTYKDLFAGQLVGLEHQYEASTGKKDFRTRLLTEKGREAAEKTHPVSAAPAGGDIASKVAAAGQTYEPDKYDYRIAPDGSVQRKAKNG